MEKDRNHLKRAYDALAIVREEAGDDAPDWLTLAYTLLHWANYGDGHEYTPLRRAVDAFRKAGG